MCGSWPPNEGRLKMGWGWRTPVEKQARGEDTFARAPFLLTVGVVIFTSHLWVRTSKGALPWLAGLGFS